jgi:hypothetical protein
MSSAPIHRRPGSIKRKGEIHRRRDGQGVSKAAWSARPKWGAWRARIFVGGRNVHLGYYSSKEEAEAAYAMGVRNYLGAAYLRVEDPPA